MKRKKSGFTLIELLTVMGVISILLGMLLPAVNMVRRMAKEAEQKAQFNTIGLALEAFKKDYGDYPESDCNPINQPAEWNYEGAQRLAEALVGWDLMGFHQYSAWRADGYDGLTPNGTQTYDPDRVRDENGDGVWDTLVEREGVYLENATENVFRLSPTGSGYDDGLYYLTDLFGPLANGGLTYVICDVFGVRKLTLQPGNTVKAGTPILYYKANTSSRIMRADNAQNSIYDSSDNLLFMRLPHLADVDKPAAQQRHHILGPAGNLEMFYNQGNPPYETYKIIDPKVTTTNWPHRPDSYILISAGMDGLYGTQDDITNF